MLNQEENRVAPKLRTAIKSIYNKCESKVKLRNGETEWSQIKDRCKTRRCYSTTLLCHIHGQMYEGN